MVKVVFYEIMKLFMGFSLTFPPFQLLPNGSLCVFAQYFLEVSCFCSNPTLHSTSMLVVLIFSLRLLFLMIQLILLSVVASHH